MTEDSGAEANGVPPTRKVAIGVVLLALVAALAWRTMEPDRLRTVVMVVLGAFALRLVLGLRGSRSDTERR